MQILKLRDCVTSSQTNTAQEYVVELWILIGGKGGFHLGHQPFGIRVPKSVETS